MHSETLRVRFTMTPAVIADPLFRGSSFIEEELRRLNVEGWNLRSKIYEPVGTLNVVVIVDLHKETVLS